MLIECGPRWPKPKVDWIIDTVGEGLHRVVSTDLADPRYQTLSGELMCDAVARWLGFEVDSTGHIQNWDAVPHLWSVADVKPKSPVQNMSFSDYAERASWPWD